MAAAHCLLPFQVTAGVTKVSSELYHHSSMNHPPGYNDMQRCSPRVVLNICGHGRPKRSRIGVLRGELCEAGNHQATKRISSVACSCQQKCDFNAKPGVLRQLKSEIRGVSVYAFLLRRSGARNGSKSMRLRAALGGDGDLDISGDVIAEDFYSVLGLTPDATPEEIKKAYYSCMKACHPDLSGNDPAVNNFCSFVNEVYEVLSDPDQRLIYDEINGYTLTAINPFRDAAAERDHAFVDEFTCIGCKNCAHTAPATFDIEEEYGRARVISQVGNPVLIQIAIETCPVDCIHWTSAQQLTLLEDEMRRMERVNVGLMLSGMGYQAPDVFTQASMRWERRQSKAVERARVRMMKEGGKSGKEAWWNVNWGSAADEKSSKTAADKYARERAAKTAAAARRWREYSRKGGDRRAIKILATETAAKAQDDMDKEKAGAL